MRVRLTVIARWGGYHAARPGRGTGKPVRIRRGPATVTGEAHRTRPQAAATGLAARAGKAPEGRARKPGDLPPTQADQPSRKGVAPPMKLRTPAGLAAGLLSAA